MKSKPQAAVMFCKLLVPTALSIACFGAAHAQSAHSVLEDFGFFGRWAPDCSKPPGPANSTRQTTITPEGEIRWTEEIGPHGLPNRYRVIEAERLAPDRVRVRVELNGEVQQDLVLAKGEGRVRTMSNRLLKNGQYLVAEGVILALKRPTPWLSKCR